MEGAIHRLLRAFHNDLLGLLRDIIGLVHFLELLKFFLRVGQGVLSALLGVHGRTRVQLAGLSQIPFHIGLQAGEGFRRGLLIQSRIVGGHGIFGLRNGEVQSSTFKRQFPVHELLLNLFLFERHQQITLSHLTAMRHGIASHREGSPNFRPDFHFRKSRRGEHAFEV